MNADRRGSEDREAFWLAVLSGERRGIPFDLLRGFLRVLELLYAAGLSVYLASERVGLRRRERLSVPVISVGNLSVGGTGKTPMTQWLVRRLVAEGSRPAILSRGHGGSLAPNVEIVSDTAGSVLRTAAEAGDEAVLLARTLPGTPVVVGKDRRESGRRAIDLYDPDILVLDDGFQYWQLDRTLDIVLLDASRPFDNGHALPRGLLREPRENLARAGIVILTRADRVDAERRRALLHEVKRLAPQSSVFFASHKPVGVIAVNSLAEGREPRNPLPVCAIAQPGSFAAMLAASGISTAGEVVAFADHQGYGDSEKALLEGKIKEYGADSLIVTEKDAVKIGADFMDIPIFALRIEIEIEAEYLFWNTVRLRVGLQPFDRQRDT